MNDTLRNPFVLFTASVLALFLIFKVLKIVLSMFWLVLAVFVVMFIFNARFRNTLRGFFKTFIH